MRLHAMLICSIAAASCFGCGASARGKAANGPGDDDLRLTAEDLAPRAVLVRHVLTSEVDHDRLRAVAPPATRFSPEQPEIFLVATLRDVPTQAQIEVRWFRDAVAEPFLDSETNGSDVFTFVSSARPPNERWRPGSYTVRILVDGREVGATSFSITGEDPAMGGPSVRNLQVALAVDGRLRPKQPASSFKRGTAELFAAFEVLHADGKEQATVMWFRSDRVFDRRDITVDGDGRFVANVVSPGGLPEGRYEVAVEIRGDERARAAFTVGNAGDGPGIDMAALGLELDGNNMPVREAGAFSQDAAAIRLGVRFLDLPAQAVIEVRWLSGGGDWDDADSLWHTTRTAVQDGGFGTMGAAWPRPDGGFDPGQYRAVVGLDDRPLLWKEFTIE